MHHVALTALLLIGLVRRYVCGAVITGRGVVAGCLLATRVKLITMFLLPNLEGTLREKRKVEFRRLDAISYLPDPHAFTDFSIKIRVAETLYLTSLTRL